MHNPQSWQPVHEHDCNTCKYLSTVISEAATYDFYFCEKAESFLGGSLIARYGDDGPDYSSCPVSILKDSYLKNDQMHGSILLSAYHLFLSMK